MKRSTRLKVAVALLCLASSGCRKESPQAGVPDHSPVGVVKASDYEVVLYSGPDGPLYTVKNRSGRELARTIDAHQLRAEFPLVFERLKGTWAGM